MAQRVGGNEDIAGPRRLRARPAASLSRRCLLAVFLALALIAAGCGGDAADTAGEPVPTTQAPEPEPAAPEPEVPEPAAPEPEVPEPEPEPEPEAPEPEPETPESEPAESEPESEPASDDSEPATDEPGDSESEPATDDSESDPEVDESEPATDEPDDSESEPATDEPDDSESEPATDEPDDSESEPATDEPDDSESEPATDETDDSESEPATDETDDSESEPATDETDETDDSESEPATDETDEPDDSESEPATDEPDDSESEPATDEPEPEPEPEPERNVAPTFDEGDSTARSVDETALPGDPVGDPVVASDGDGDTLIYSFDGPDAASFAIDFLTGQIRTRAALDRSAQATHTLTVAVSDGKDADGNPEQPAQTDDTIEVTVTVDAVVVAEFATLTVYLQGDTTTPVTSVDGPGQRTFTVVGTGWTGLHTTPTETPTGIINIPALFLTSCLVPSQGELDFFLQCDSDGLHTFAGVQRAEAGSQELSSLYASDPGVRTAVELIGTKLAALSVATDGSFRLDMPVDVPAGGVIIIAAVGNVDLRSLLSTDLISIVKAVTVRISS